MEEIQKPPNLTRLSGFSLEAPPRLELGIKALQASALPLGYGAILQKTHCASFVFGAEDEIRTRDVHLGKVTLYH